MAPLEHTFIPRDDALIISLPFTGPITNPSLLANLICRVFLAILANLVCVVPLRLLYKNNEFAAVVYIVNTMVKNCETILNSLIWRNDDLANWWPGYGLCDANPYVHNFSQALFVTTLLAIMRNIALQVGLLRVHPLSVTEKRRRNLVQALIIFPLPILQAALTFPLAQQRFAVGTLVGCAWNGAYTWQYLVFFIIAPTAVALATAVYAVLTFFRFRELAKSTQSALSSNRAANHRAQRTKRRLYLMVVSVMVPFLPLVLALTIYNLVSLGPLQPFDWNDIHHHQTPYPWNTITYLSSKDIDFAFMNNAYISIWAAVPVFVFFGLTKDAVNDYRRLALFVGLGRCFPCLYQEYDPDRFLESGGSWRSGVFSRSGTWGGKLKSVTSSQQLSTISSHSGDQSAVVQHHDIPSSVDEERGEPHTSPYTGGSVDAPGTLSPRNPFLFRTALDPSSFTFPMPKTLWPFNRSGRNDRTSVTEIIPTAHSTAPNLQPPWTTHETTKPAIETRVWSANNEDTTVSHSGINEHSTANNNAGETLASPYGVVVRTALTRESHQTEHEA